MLAEQDLDYLVAYADDRATFGPAHARWLANFPVHFEPACVLLPREGAPVMLVGPASDQYALLSGRIGPCTFITSRPGGLLLTLRPSPTSQIPGISPTPAIGAHPALCPVRS